MRTQQRGSILLLTLVFLFLMGLLVMDALQGSLFMAKLNQAIANRQQAFIMAQSGLHYMQHRIGQNIPVVKSPFPNLSLSANMLIKTTNYAIYRLQANARYRQATVNLQKIVIVNAH